MLGGIGEMVLLVVLAPKDVVAVVVEQRLMQKHSAAVLARQRLGHKGGVATALVGLLLNDELGRGDGIGHAQGLGVAQAHAVLRAAGGVEGVLHGHGHLLEREDRVAAQVAGGVAHRKVKVAHVVERLGRVLVGEVIVLQLGTHVEQVAGLLGLIEHAAQGVARVAGKRPAIGGAHVAEHAGDAVVARAPRQDLEGRSIGKRQHVGFLGRSKALDGRAVKANTLLKSDLEVLGANGKVLEAAENVDKPQTHKADVTLLYGAEYVINVLLVHVAPLSFGRVSTGLYRRYYRRKMFPQG